MKIQWSKHDQDSYAGGLVPPAYPGDAGYDICSSRTVAVPASGMAQIPTNMCIAIPDGYWALLVGRSSSFLKKQLLIQAAIIDNGYRGELWAVVKNITDRCITVTKKERLIQLILLPLYTPEIEEVLMLPPSDRGESGFGSTGGFQIEEGKCWLPSEL